MERCPNDLPALGDIETSKTIMEMQAMKAMAALKFPGAGPAPAANDDYCCGIPRISINPMFGIFPDKGGPTNLSGIRAKPKLPKPGSPGRSESRAGASASVTAAPPGGAGGGACGSHWQSGTKTSTIIQAALRANAERLLPSSSVAANLSNPINGGKGKTVGSERGDEVQDLREVKLLPPWDEIIAGGAGKLMGMYLAHFCKETAELQEDIDGCVKAFPTPVDGGGTLGLSGLKLDVVVYFNSKMKGQRPIKTEAGEYLALRGGVRLLGDELISGDFRIKIGLDLPLDAVLADKIKLSQIALSGEKLRDAFSIITSMAKYKDELPSDPVKLIGLLIEAVESTQGFFLSPYAKKVDEDNRNKAPEEKRAIFKQQPPNIDAYFFIEDFKLVLRSNMAGNTLRNGRVGSPLRLRANSVLTEPDSFRVTAFVECLDDVGRRLKKILGKAKMFRERMEHGLDMIAHW